VEHRALIPKRFQPQAFLLGKQMFKDPQHVEIKPDENGIWRYKTVITRVNEP
jgi:hypothetical protein